MNLRWGDVDLDRGSILLQLTKMESDALSLLLEQR